MQAQITKLHTNCTKNRGNIALFDIFDMKYMYLEI